MNIAFRFDAGPSIGLGHAARSLTLARALKSLGYNVLAVVRDTDPFVCESLGASGIPFVSLPEGVTVSDEDLPCSSWLRVSRREDAEHTVSALRDFEADWVVVDHYALDSVWEQAVRAVARHVMVIDDTGDRLHDCSLLVDQNLEDAATLRYTGRVPAGCRILAGPRYALLRDEFRSVHKRTRDGSIHRLLAYFGGADSHNLTPVLVCAFDRLMLPDVDLTVIVSSTNPRSETVRSSCSSMQRVRCLTDVDNMAELMSEADFAIGAAGSSTWERACMGLPSITVALAENQVEIADTAVRGGFALPLVELDENGFMEGIRRILALSPYEVVQMGRAGMETVDGRGIDRVVKEMEDLR